MFIMGDVFLRNYYTVLDWENNQIGLAVNKISANNVEPITLFDNSQLNQSSNNTNFEIILLVVSLMMMVLWVGRVFTK